MIPILRRTFPVALTVEERDGQPPQLVGHAAVFNILSRDLGGYRERIMPGAFLRAVNGTQADDIVALFNHNENFPLGRTSAGTLQIREDGKGLAVNINPPDTSYARDLMVSMKRGDVRDMSFAFRPVTSVRSSDANGPIIERHDVELFDVSPVVFPAFPQTDIAVRAALLKRDIDMSAISAIFDKLANGEAPTPDDVAAVADAIAALEDLSAQVSAVQVDPLADPNDPAIAADGTDQAMSQARHLAYLRMRLDLLAL